MRKLVLICVASVMSFAMVSCGGSGTDKKAEKDGSEQVAGSFTAHTEKAGLKWTAYKFTNRVGVSGTFDDIQSSGSKAATSVPGSLEGMEFKINTSSVNSSSEDRDGKLKQYFFGTMNGGAIIEGKFSSFEGEFEGVYHVDIALNRQRRPLKLKYKVSGEEIELIGKLNLGDFQAEKSVESINKKCDVLHTGTDGVSKLWPDVDIEIHIPFTSK